MFTKLMASKEQEKRYKKIVDNPLCTWRSQILPEEHQPEINSFQFRMTRPNPSTGRSASGPRHRRRGPICVPCYSSGQRAGQGVIPDGGGPNKGPTEPAGSCGRREMGKVPEGGNAGDRGPELLYAILGRRGIQASSLIWAAEGSTSNGSQQCAPRVRPYQPEDSRRTGSHHPVLDSSRFPETIHR